MKKPMNLLQAALAVVGGIAWTVFPVLSLVFIVRLFSMDGWTLAMRFNEIMLLPYLFMIMMLIAALIGNKKASLIACALNVITCIVLVALRKSILVGGNIRWLYDTASVLLNPLAQQLNISITVDNIGQIICDYMIPGTGFWVHMACSLGYFLISLLNPETKNTTGGATGTRVSAPPTVRPAGSSANQKSPYNHRT